MPLSLIFFSLLFGFLAFFLCKEFLPFASFLILGGDFLAFVLCKEFLAILIVFRFFFSVWEKDVWDFQGKSGSSGSCRLFLCFLGNIVVPKISGKAPGSPRHPSSRHPWSSDKKCPFPSFSPSFCSFEGLRAISKPVPIPGTHQTPVENVFH